MESLVNITQADEEHTGWYNATLNVRFLKGATMQMYIYSCEACNITAVDRVLYCGTVMNPGLQGWEHINGSLYCPNHKIEVKNYIDGEVL